MSLDVAALETALPAAVIAAVAGAPGGLTTAATQVYVGRQKRSQGVTSPEAWARPLDRVPVEGGLGHSRGEYPYELTIEHGAGTLAILTGWRDALFAYFDGFCRPFVTGLWAVRVDDVDMDMHEGQGPAVALRARLTFQEG